MSALFLDALHCRNTDRPPIWLMRQAGRYMPSYRTLRKTHSLGEMFRTPELAVKVSLLPLELLGVDAAILFSDILRIAETLGLTVHFPDTGGPRVVPAVRSSAEVDALPLLPVEEVLSDVMQTLRLLKQEIKVPLIGFCGGPFTVASYLIDSERGEAFQHTKTWMEQDPVSFHRLLQKITESSIALLKAQICAGADVVQIFDSWASVLTPTQFHTFCLPYLRQMVAALPETPVILFCRSSSLYPQELAKLSPRCISFDWQRPLATLRAQVPADIAVQGNLDPTFLKLPKEEIASLTHQLLSSMQGEKGFIVNLGHGVLPDTPFEHVHYFVETVKLCVLPRT